MGTVLYELDISLPKGWGDFTSEQLYWMLANRREMLDDRVISECVDILVNRMLSIALGLSKSRRKQFGWDYSDAKMDIYEFMWHLIVKGGFKKHWMDCKNDRDFRMYFCRAYRYHLIDEYRRLALHGLIPVGDRIMGFLAGDIAVYYEVSRADSEYAEMIRARNRKNQRKYMEKRRSHLKHASN